MQEPLVRYAREIGWVELSRDEALSLRGGESGMFLNSILRDKLIELNPGVVTMENVEAVIRRVEDVRNTIEGNAETLAWLRGEKSIFLESEKRHRNVRLVDFERPANNAFQVTAEWQYTNGRHRNRADAMFILNGIPVALVETKNARRKDALEEGLDQVRRYHRETPELVTAPQVFDITNLIGFDYGATWSLDRKNIFKWKGGQEAAPTRGGEEPGNFEEKVKRFFARERFLRMLKDWILFYRRDDDLHKVILRQHQTRGVERVVERALDPVKKRGLIWHTQGAGKTFTMITAAKHILGDPAFGAPTVIMVVDRNELESQLFGNLEASGLAYREVESKKDLREVLRSDYRGLLVTTIHKFDQADADLCTRDNVFIFVDEAHRSTGGDLGNYLVAALPNATLIGFTGTPIDRTAHGEGTFKIFGKDDAPRGYLDKYSIQESIDDGTTLPLHYEFAPNEIRVPREDLEREFLNLAEAQGVSDITELNRILDRAVRLKNFLKAPDRVEKVAKFVADHFRTHIEPLGYKAFLVGVDREACALYKRALDAHLPPDYSVAVYTDAPGDSALLKAYHLNEDDEKQIRKKFVRKDDLPKILIVTEKLLTGYDAPILYCMYLDKPMRDHVLLQAIARVNRPYEEQTGRKKPAGFVLDFVGIFEKLEKALAFDSDEVNAVISHLDVLKSQFQGMMKGKAPEYLALMAGRRDDKAVERAIDALADKDAREAFLAFFHDLEVLYEIISPDQFLRPSLDDYLRLADLYQIVTNAYRAYARPDEVLMRKTEALVRERATAYVSGEALPAVKIDEAALEMLKKGKMSANAKVINLGMSLLRDIQERADEEPYLIPLEERVKDILQKYEDRQLTTQAALVELEQQMRVRLDARRERERSGLDVGGFAAYWALKQAGISDAESVARELGATMKRFPDHQHNPEDMRLLKSEIYKVLLPLVGKETMVDIADQMLEVRRR